MRKNKTGFSLIELLITIAILGILLAVAVPSYQSYVRKSHRIEALNFAQRFALAQEELYNTHYAYGWFSHLKAAGLGGFTESHGDMLFDDRFKVQTTKTNNTFSITLTAQGDQAKDADCVYVFMNEKSQLNQSELGLDRFCYSKNPN